jgi:predicted Zn-dependent peptidase
MADLNRASLDEVRAFHDRYYAPDNAVLSIAGDFEPGQVLELVRRHFTNIPARRAPAWVDPGMTPQTAERTETMTDPLARLPAFHVVYHIPPRRTPDHYALEILAVLLGGGEASRLYQTLVKDREIASSIQVSTDDRRGPDVFNFWCILAAGHAAPEARTVIYQQLEDIARQGVPGRELDKARNQFRAGFVFALQSNLSRARHLGEFELYDGNAALLRTELDHYLAVTAADVQRVANQYFTAANRTVLDVQVAPQNAPAAPTPPTTPAAPARPTGPATTPAARR